MSALETGRIIAGIKAISLAHNDRLNRIENVLANMSVKKPLGLEPMTVYSRIFTDRAASDNDDPTPVSGTVMPTECDVTYFVGDSVVTISILLSRMTLKKGSTSQAQLDVALNYIDASWEDNDYEQQTIVPYSTSTSVPADSAHLCVAAFHVRNGLAELSFSWDSGDSTCVLRGVLLSATVPISAMKYHRYERLTRTRLASVDHLDSTGGKTASIVVDHRPEVSVQDTFAWEGAPIVSSYQDAFEVSSNDPIVVTGIPNSDNGPPAIYTPTYQGTDFNPYQPMTWINAVNGGGNFFGTLV